MYRIILASYIGIVIDHYKDPYIPTSRIESKSFLIVFFLVAHVFCLFMLYVHDC